MKITHEISIFYWKGVCEMGCYDPKGMLKEFQRNYRIILRQTNGLTHSDSLLQLPFRGNCLNWVLGHIVEERQQVLALLGLPLIWKDKEIARYKTDSEPVTPENAATALPLEKLLADLKKIQSALDESLGAVEPGELDKETESEGHTLPLGEWIAGFLWHETYHTGQLEILRQLAGKDDKVI